MNVLELALLKIMHERISPNSCSMEHYAKTFHALCISEQANRYDIQRLTGVDPKCAEHVLQKLAGAGIVSRDNGEFTINLQTEKLCRLITENETPQRKPRWKPQLQNNTALPRKIFQPLVCTSRIR
ncbi:MAG: hypothetical protein V1777_03945 [Candidatus Micrarchaeota archaeon]